MSSQEEDFDFDENKSVDYDSDDDVPADKNDPEESGAADNNGSGTQRINTELATEDVGGIDEDEDEDEDEEEEDEDGTVTQANQHMIDTEGDTYDTDVDDDDAMSYDDVDDVDDVDDGGGDEYVDYQQNVSKDLIDTYHHESKTHNYAEVNAMTAVVRDDNGIISDALHRTVPMLTKFEKARIMGMRIKQLNGGADTFVDVPSGMIDTRVIAEMELSAKKLPFIIRRPLPNGSSEYWKVSDLSLM